MSKLTTMLNTIEEEIPHLIQDMDQEESARWLRLGGAGGLGISSQVAAKVARLVWTTGRAGEPPEVWNRFVGYDLSGDMLFQVKLEAMCASQSRSI